LLASAGADHHFSGREKELAAAIREFVAQLGAK
jgi:alpha/beta superfamily hydrolase